MGRHGIVTDDGTIVLYDHPGVVSQSRMNLWASWNHRYADSEKHFVSG